MAKLCLLKWVPLALLACLCAANLPAQDPEMIPPPIPAVLPPPPPDPDTLPPPPPMAWEPLAPKGEEDQSIPVPAAAAAAVEPETAIAPPPPPITEPLLPGVPDPEEAEAARPDVEVWRPDGISPQTPPRGVNRLAPALVAGNATVTLMTHFGPAAAGKTVYIRPGRGITLGSNDGEQTISPTGDCNIAAQLADGWPRSHIIFYCEGIRTVLPIVRRSRAEVEAAEEMGGGE